MALEVPSGVFVHASDKIAQSAWGHVVLAILVDHGILLELELPAGHLCELHAGAGDKTL
jgi:hypothetical protein